MCSTSDESGTWVLVVPAWRNGFGQIVQGFSSFFLAIKNEEKLCSMCTCFKPIYRLIPGTRSVTKYIIWQYLIIFRENETLISLPILMRQVSL